MVIIILLIICVILFVVLSYLKRSKKCVLNAFKKGNVIVYGSKGKGKDLLFQYVINCNKNTNYYSNVDYGGNFNYLDLKDLEINNNFENMINGDINVIEKNEKFENADIYISDGGIYLPAQKDTLLHKKHDSLPLVYALQRHLYNSNTHVNTQALERVWKSLREQADSYIKCNGVFKLPFILIVSFTYYDKYESAINNILPMKKGFVESKENKALRQQFESTNGVIKNGCLILSKKHIKYDTRVFHEKIFGKKAN